MSPTLREKLAEYDSLPDDALVSDAVAAVIHDRQDPLIDAIMAQQPRTLAGLAVVARAFTLHHAEQWEPDADDGLHHRTFMEAVCAIAGVVPVPTEAVQS
jgi:hypothetical protein